MELGTTNTFKPSQESSGQKIRAKTKQPGKRRQIVHSDSESDVQAVKSESRKQIEISFGRGGRKSKLTNKVRTTKYTLMTWAPVSLLMQFKRAANIYFLIISILTMMWFSPKSPASMIGTFAAVLFFTMVKEAFEDFQRFRSDKELNNRDTLIWSGAGYRRSKWADIKVGDIVKVTKDEEIPADLLIVAAPKDIVFVSTMNLDGETNLKDRELALNPKDMLDLDMATFEGKIECDSANASLEKWDGNLSALGKKEACQIKNLVLRGTMLKNTEYVIGVSVYVGADTKIFKNSKKPPRKVSKLMNLMNKLLYSVFVFQMVIIIVYASVSV